MHSVQPDDQAEGSREGDENDKDLEKTPSNSSRNLPDELESPTGSNLPYNPSPPPGTQSWISRGDFDTVRSLESWRQEVSVVSD